MAIREELGAERRELVEEHRASARSLTIAFARTSFQVSCCDLVERIRDLDLGGGPFADMVDYLQLDRLGELHGLGDGDLVLLRYDLHVDVHAAETKDATVRQHLVQEKKSDLASTNVIHVDLGAFSLEYLETGNTDVVPGRDVYI